VRILPGLAEESVAMRSGSGKREGVIGPAGEIDSGSAELEGGATVSRLCYGSFRVRYGCHIALHPKVVRWLIAGAL
jgi:hypothetical protein